MNRRVKGTSSFSIPFDRMPYKEVFDDWQKQFGEKSLGGRLQDCDLLRALKTKAAT